MDIDLTKLKELSEKVAMIFGEMEAGRIPPSLEEKTEWIQTLRAVQKLVGRSRARGGKKQ